MPIDVENLLIRKAGPEDFAHIASIFNENIALGDCTLWDRSFSTEELRSIAESMDDREGYYVAQLNKQTIGWGSITKYHKKGGYRFTCETSVFFARAFTGRGYGSVLKQHLLNQCRLWGYHHVLARVMATNKRSIEYNLRLGYELVGTQREIGMVNGVWQDVVIMQYLIT